VNGNGQTATAPSPPQDPIQVIARQKSVSPESLQVFGAKAITPFMVRLRARWQTMHPLRPVGARRQG
jgi:hypothetical protein